MLTQVLQVTAGLMPEHCRCGYTEPLCSRQSQPVCRAQRRLGVPHHACLVPINNLNPLIVQDEQLVLLDSPPPNGGGFSRLNKRS